MPPKTRSRSTTKADDKAAEKKAAEKKAADKKAADKKAAEKKAAEKKAADKKAAEKKAADKKAEKKAADSKAPARKAAGGKASGGKASGAKASGAKASGRAAASGDDGSGSEVAAALGRDDAVSRQTKSRTTAASYITRDHDVIREWVQERGGTPADVRGTGDGGGAGVLRIEFRDEQDRLEDVDWDPFFETFDRSDVDFLYQEHTADGSVSRFNKFVREA